MFTSSIKRRIGRFHVVAVRWTSKKCNKKHDHTWGEVVLFNLPLSCLLKLPNIENRTFVI